MAGNCLPPAEVTASGRPVLLPNEIECYLLSSVDVECDGLPNFPILRSGLLSLTTHRLLWLPDSSSSASAATAVPLAAVSHIFSPKKSLRAMFASPRLRFQVSVSSEGRVIGTGPGFGPGSRSVVVTVVVRGKGDCDAFLAKFWESWRGRAWESEAAGSNDQSGSVSGSGSGLGSGSGGMYSRDGTVRMVGVSGILRKEQEMWESTDKSLQDAFQDLNALMVMPLNTVFLVD